jgi:hypothetical protein
MLSEKAWRDFREAERLLAEGGRRIEEQTKIVEQLKQEGGDTARAREQLVRMLNDHERHKYLLAKLRDWMEAYRITPQDSP